MHTKNKAKFSLLNASIIWGISSIFLEVTLDYITPLHAVTMRFGIAVLILTFFLLLKRKHRFPLVSSKTCIILGWLDAFGYLAATIGQNMTTAGLATLISTSYVFIVPFLAWKVDGTKPRRQMIVLALPASLGIFLISFNGDWTNFSGISILGILVLICAALFFAVYSVVSGKMLNITNTGDKKIDPLDFMHASLLHTFLPLFILSIITTKSSVFSFPLKIIPLLAFSAMFPTIIAFGLYNWAIARLGSVQTSFYSLFQVIVPFVCEFILFHQLYTGWVYGGIVFLLISLVIPQEQTENETLRQKPDAHIASLSLKGSLKASLKKNRLYSRIFC